MAAVKPSKEAKQLTGWLTSLGHDVEIMEPTLLVVRMATKQLQVPLVIQVDDIVFFDLYPFRFVAAEIASVDWPFLVQLATETQLLKICIDAEMGDGKTAPLFYSVQLPLEVLSKALVGGVLQLLKKFAEERYAVVMDAAGLSEISAAKLKKRKKAK